MCLVRTRRGRKLGQEVGQGRRQWELADPLRGCVRQASHVAVGTHDVHVARVKRRDGDGAPPEDEVLGVLADLSRGENAAPLLAHLMEAAVPNETWSAREDTA